MNFYQEHKANLNCFQHFPFSLFIQFQVRLVWNLLCSPDWHQTLDTPGSVSQVLG
jgi:hypothetical protein